ncbi:MAG: hypothetical protein OEW06_16810 [Gemmatimonadota bacterium]|nr:hypothetical protein [Gemmatimonadota bacterium]
MALQDYRGPRPGIALTIAAAALLVALVVGVFHLMGLGRSAAILANSQRTIQTLNRYNATLEVWRQMATGNLRFEQQRQLRDSLAFVLRTNLDGLRQELTDSTDRMLVSTILADLDVSPATPQLQLGVAGREAIIVLTVRQDSALLTAASESQRSRVIGAVLIGLTVVAAAVLIVPLSWAYVRFKRGIPPGL